MLTSMLARALFLRSPRSYRLLYLAAIPIFALLCWEFFSGSFYAPYAKLEQVAFDDQRTAGQVVENALHRVAGDKKLNVDGYDLNFKIWAPTGLTQAFDLDSLLTFRFPQMGK